MTNQNKTLTTEKGMEEENKKKLDSSRNVAVGDGSLRADLCQLVTDHVNLSSSTKNSYEEAKKSKRGVACTLRFHVYAPSTMFPL